MTWISRLKANLFPIAETVRNGCALTRQVCPNRLKPPPVSQDLIERLLLVILLPRSVRFDTLFPVARSLIVLPAIDKNLRKCLEGFLTVVCLWVIRDLLVNLDEIEFVGQSKAFDPSGEIGNGFFLAERLQGGRVDACLAPTIRDGLNAELLSQEFGEPVSDFVFPTRFDLHRLRQ